MGKKRKFKKCNCVAKPLIYPGIYPVPSVTIHKKGCPKFFCPSTHGGAGYTMGDYKNEKGEIICIICGEKCNNNGIVPKFVYQRR